MNPHQPTPTNFHSNVNKINCPLSPLSLLSLSFEWILKYISFDFGSIQTCSNLYNLSRNFQPHILKIWNTLSFVNIFYSHTFKILHRQVDFQTFSSIKQSQIKQNDHNKIGIKVMYPKVDSIIFWLYTIVSKFALNKRKKGKVYKKTIYLFVDNNVLSTPQLWWRFIVDIQSCLNNSLFCHKIYWTDKFQLFPLVLLSSSFFLSSFYLISRTTEPHFVFV